MKRGQGPAGHARLRQPLRGSRLGRRDLRRRGGRGARAVPGPGDGHHPHRLPRAGLPGLRRLPQGDAQGRGASTASSCRTASSAAPRSSRRKASATWRHGRRGQLRLCQPADHHPLGAGDLRAGSSGSAPGTWACELVYDVAHNIAKIEDAHGGRQAADAVRAPQGRHPRLSAGPSRRLPGGLPRDSASRCSIPGDMGRYSYVLVGTEQAMEETFGSTCHGAGRLMSRHQAMKVARGRSIIRELAAAGHHRPGRRPGHHRRGDARGLQGRQPSGGRGPRRRHRQEGGPAAAVGGIKG